MVKYLGRKIHKTRDRKGKPQDNKNQNSPGNIIMTGEDVVTSSLAEPQ
jgi:hypothetical protein